MVQRWRDTKKGLKYKNMNLPLILEVKMMKNSCNLWLKYLKTYPFHVILSNWDLLLILEVKMRKNPF